MDRNPQHWIKMQKKYITDFDPLQSEKKGLPELSPSRIGPCINKPKICCHNKL